MRAVHKEYNVYKFKELTEENQQKALEKLWNINVNYAWYEYTCDDAKTIGLKIEGFDIDRGSYVKAKFIEDACYTADKIIENHGETSETYTLAKEFQKERDSILDQAEKDENGDPLYLLDVDTKLDECEENFLKDLCEEYLVILHNEYEYLTSKEVVIETINANDYEFTEAGLLGF